MDSSFFLREKPVRVLIALSDKSRSWYAHLLSKEVDVTYAHLINVLDALSVAGLVSFEREGRIKLVRITDDGLELAKDFETVVRRLSKLSKSGK
ncbi:MAG: winged helix DNA-binding protein [Candidatus Diapherotrites archaeon]|nr:winged helix DNA-binding protein [Candidatus Diapherotrites archaeon]